MQLKENKNCTLKLFIYPLSILKFFNELKKLVFRNKLRSVVQVVLQLKFLCKLLYIFAYFDKNFYLIMDGVKVASVLYFMNVIEFIIFIYTLFFIDFMLSIKITRTTKKLTKLIINLIST